MASTSSTFDLEAEELSNSIQAFFLKHPVAKARLAMLGEGFTFFIW